MFEKLLNNIKGNTISVIGDIMLDNFMFGSVERISPEAPVPVVNYNRGIDTLGGCGNVINNLSNLDIKVNIISKIGNDSAGDKIINKLKQLNIETQYLIVDKKIDTIKKMRIIADGQHRLAILLHLGEKEITLPDASTAETNTSGKK